MLIHGDVRYGIPLLAVIAGIVGIRIWQKRRNPDWPLVLRTVALAGMLVFLLFKASRRYTYINMWQVGVLVALSAPCLHLLRSEQRNRVRCGLTGVLALCLLVGLWPSVRTLLLPLQWTEGDRYEGNRAALLAHVPPGSVLLTDPRFWHVCDEGIHVLDKVFSRHALPKADFVLTHNEKDLPQAHQAPEGVDNVAAYFGAHFAPAVSTAHPVSPQDDRRWSFRRARESYRFVLYRRSTQAPQKLDNQ
jgi:hypothetical protein